MEKAKKSTWVDYRDTALNVPDKDPKVAIITEEGQEEITTIKKKKHLKFEGCDDKKATEKEEKPQEKIMAGDVIIKNYDVDFEEEEPELKLMGGIRGIRALRVQREYLKDID